MPDAGSEGLKIRFLNLTSDFLLLKSNSFRPAMFNTKGVLK